VILDGRLSGSAAGVSHNDAARKRVSVRWALGEISRRWIRFDRHGGGSHCLSPTRRDRQGVPGINKVRGITLEVVQDIKQRMTNMGYSTQDTAAGIDDMSPELWPQIIAAGWLRIGD